MKFRPLNDYILVEMIHEPADPSRLILPESHNKSPNTAKVVEVSASVANSSSSVDPGDIIMFRKHAGMEMIIEDRPYLLIRREDILGSVYHA